MTEPNRYGYEEIIEYLALPTPNGIWVPVQYAVIGHRKTINGQPVNDDGSPKKR